jgi:hypothetical protein
VPKMTVPLRQVQYASASLTYVDDEPNIIGVRYAYIYIPYRYIYIYRIYICLYIYEDDDDDDDSYDKSIQSNQLLVHIDLFESICIVGIVD